MQPAVLPWAEGESEAGNMPGKSNKDPWESQSLPVGNGRVGGTVFGGDKRERVNLNEVSLWAGGPNLPDNDKHQFIEIRYSNFGTRVLPPLSRPGEWIFTHAGQAG